MKITAVGALAILGIVVILVLFARFLQNQSPENRSNP